MAYDAQKQIRENTMELQDFLKDLKQWEDRVKEKDKKLKSQAQHEVKEVPPIRGQAISSMTKHMTQLPKSRNVGPTSSENAKTETVRNKATTAASHTYDKFRDKWDKFDVDAALREVDRENVPKSSHQEVSGKFQSGPTSEKKPETAKEFSCIQTDGKNDSLRTFQGLTSSSYSLESFSEATAEKELGNQCFKEKKFVKAIDHYSQSIAIQPSAVAYANRAMAYIKIRRFKDAEIDCTEAIALDDRYVKAYSRRSTARKELGLLLGAVEDAEFGLRLEPESKELKQQYLEAKSLCEKKIAVKEEVKLPLHIEEVKSQSTGQGDSKRKTALDNSSQVVATGVSGQHISKVLAQPANGEKPQTSTAATIMQSLENHRKSTRSVNDVTVQALAAARLATDTPLVAPKTFYEFEAMWKSFSGNMAQQAELLKVMTPSNFPSLFKDNLSPNLLSGIIRSLEHLFPDNASHAVGILESLPNVRRFNMALMCLTSKEKTDLREIWERIFVGGQCPSDRIKILSGLRMKYQL